MSEDRRALILDAAIKLLEREGAAALKQTRVAQEAGVEQGHLTYYFPKKADLVLAVFARAGERTREDIARMVARSSTHSPKRRFFEVAAALAKDRKRTRLLLALIVESQGDPDVARPIAENIRMQRQAIGALLGRSEDDLEVELALAALKGIGLEQMVLGTPPDHVDALVAQLEKWLVRGTGRNA
jgi:AcrR family transcriptional regulator